MRKGDTFGCGHAGSYGKRGANRTQQQLSRKPRSCTWNIRTSQRFKVTNEVQRPRNSQGWEAPETGSVKVNCDASWCRQTKTGGLRVVARNSDDRLTEEANRRETKKVSKGTFITGVSKQHAQTSRDWLAIWKWLNGKRFHEQQTNMQIGLLNSLD